MEGALGRQQARRLPHLRLAGREGRDQPLRDLDPARRLADPHARSERAVSRPEGRAAAGPAAGAERVLRASASCWRIGFFMIAAALFGAWLWWRGTAVRDALVSAHRGANLVDRLRRRASPAGSSPKAAASPGSCTASCAPPTRSRRCRARSVAGDAGPVRRRLRHRVRDGHLLHQPPDRAGPQGCAVEAPMPGPRSGRCRRRATPAREALAPADWEADHGMVSAADLGRR